MTVSKSTNGLVDGSDWTIAKVVASGSRVVERRTATAKRRTRIGSYVLARVYENSSVRRLGYLLELAGHKRQSKLLESFAREAKSLKPLDPAATPLVAALSSSKEKNAKWMLLIKEHVEVEP